MQMVGIQLNLPEAMVPYATQNDECECHIRNAMIMYPFIRRGEISHGYAAEILGMNKMDLIELYGALGLPYFTQTEENVKKDLATLQSLQENIKC